jgi:aspartate carbamoyltransferase catalytic subunit
MLKGRHLVEPGNFSIEEMDGLFTLAERIEADPGYLRESCWQPCFSSPAPGPG